MAKLLFVDDEPSHETLIKMRFRQEIKENEYDISFARNGDEALKIIDYKLPDLLLTDLKVPALQMNGFELIKTLKQKQIYLRTIVISAYAEMDNICESLKHDVLSFVPKPFEIAKLKTLIDLALQKSNKQISPIYQSLDAASTLDQSSSLTLSKSVKLLSMSQRVQLIKNTIETLGAKEIGELQETLPDFLATQVQIATERKTTLQILKEKQRSGEIPNDIPLDERFLRIIKRPIKSNGVEYGPYYYIIWRDDNGRSKSKCVGLRDPREI